jgi:hypothetical protein
MPGESETHRALAVYTVHARELEVQVRHKLMMDWFEACAAYRTALHANASYRQAAQEYLQRQNREPQPLLDLQTPAIFRHGTSHRIA